MLVRHFNVIFIFLETPDGDDDGDLHTALFSPSDRKRLLKTFSLPAGGINTRSASSRIKVDSCLLTRFFWAVILASAADALQQNASFYFKGRSRRSRWTN